MKNIQNKALTKLGAGVGINLTLGVLYIWSIVSKNLVAVQGWTNQEASMPYTIAILGWSLGALIAGSLQDRFGPRRFVLTGVSLVGLGLFASGFSNTPKGMILTFGLLVGLGVGFAYSSVTPAVMKWFHRDSKGLVTGLVVAGFALASAYLAPTAYYLINGLGLSTTFWILGIFSLLSGIPLALIIKNPPKDYIPSSALTLIQKEPAKPKQPWFYKWYEMVRTRQFRVLWLMYAFSASAGLMIISNISSIAAEQAGYKTGFVLVIVLALFNSLGRIISGSLSDRIGRITTLQIAFCIQGVNMVLFVLYQSTSLMLVGAALSGLAYGSLLSVFPTVISDYYGMRDFGINYGILFTSFGLAGFIGPLLAAFIRDYTGNYGFAYIVSAILLAACFFLSKSIVPVTGRLKQ
ncbi:MAG: permease [Fusobacteria bacterium]|nr:MAG: permease [Fusobacteriota bacterium]KAF0230282.1 MAG: hypothetical protein FD182_672 [Fusobacteriota bacterium]